MFSARGDEPTHSRAQRCPEKEGYKFKLILPSQPLYFYVFGETEQEAFSWYILWYIQKEFWEEDSCAVESLLSTARCCSFPSTAPKHFLREGGTSFGCRKLCRSSDPGKSTYPEHLTVLQFPDKTETLTPNDLSDPTELISITLPPVLFSCQSTILGRPPQFCHVSRAGV